MHHCKFSLSPQTPLYDFFDEPDPLGLSIFIHVPCLALGWSTWGPYDDILKILSPITCSLESSANRGLSCSARLSLWSCLYQFLSLPTSFPTPCVQTDTHVLNALFGWAMLVQNMPLGPLASPRSFKCFPLKLRVSRKMLCFHSFTPNRRKQIIYHPGYPTHPLPIPALLQAALQLLQLLQQLQVVVQPLPLALGNCPSERSLGTVSIGVHFNAIIMIVLMIMIVD